MISIVRQVEHQVKVTPKELAEIFASADASQQAEFFNELAKQIKNWDASFGIQLHSISTNETLNQDGRYVMSQIGEYAYQK